MSSAANVSSVSEEKLKTERVSDGDTTCVRFEGVMDESFEGKRLGVSIRAKNLVLDMGRISKISSFGIREWSEFISVVTRNVENIYMIECTAKVMDQVNMVAGFIGKARIISFYGPYRCDHCDVDRDVIFQVDRDGPAIRSFEPPEQLCPTCARPQFFDEDPSSFFSTVAQQPQFDLAQGVPEFLAAKLNYNIAGGNRRLQIDKYIEGSFTFLRFSGNLDGAFSSEKVAEGLEGSVVVDVAGLGGVDIAGAAEWRNFVTLARKGATRIYLLDCPPVLLERLPRTEDLGDEVISFSMPYNCPSCSTTTSEIVDVGEHYEILKFATPPEMRCGNCKQATACAAQESLLSRLRDLQKPTANSKLRAFIKAARKRKPEKQASEEAATGMVAGKKTKGLIVVSLTAVLGAAGLMVYNASKQRDTKSRLDKATQKIDDLVTQKKQERPSWIRSSNPFSGTCLPEIGSVICVGISSYRTNLEDAKAEAQDVALEAVADSLAISLDSDLFDVKVRPLYSDVRRDLLAQFDEVSEQRTDPKYKALVKKISEIRHRTAVAIVASSNDSMPKQHSGLFWEKYEDDDGKDPEYLVFTRFQVTTAAQRAMQRIYTSEKEIGGGKVVTAFPLLAWSYSNFEGGVVVTDAQGPFVNVGEGAVIVGVGGQSISNAVKLGTAMKGGGALEVAEKAATDEAPTDEPAPEKVEPAKPAPAETTPDAAAN